MLHLHTGIALLLAASIASAFERIEAQDAPELLADDIVYYVVRSPSGRPESEIYTGGIMSLYTGRYSLWMDDWLVIGQGSVLRDIDGIDLDIIFARDPIIFRAYPNQD